MTTCVAPPPVPARILVADDHQVLRVAITRMLRHLGYTTEAVCNGCDAVRAASRTAFDFIFLDIQMPCMDGLEAAHALQQQSAGGAAARIVGLSAEDLDRETYSAAGMDAFLIKPVRLADLARVLASFDHRQGT